jgi:hypothetical protein
METPMNATDVASASEEEDTNSGDKVEERSEEHQEDEGFGEDAEVPEYAQLRHENLRKNNLKLQELGVPLLATSFKESTITCTTKAGGGEGSTRRAGVSSLGRRTLRSFGY